MQIKQTLVSMFEANKQALEKELTGLKLPKDVNKIQNVVANYFDSLFNQSGEYRQNLSVSEDYILQAALSLLNAQQEMGRKLTEKEIEVKTRATFAEENKSKKENSPIETFLSQKLDGTKTLIGAGSGAVLGKMAFSSGWGAVFGAIAGTAIVLYLATKSGKKDVGENVKAITAKPKIEAAIVNSEIDVVTFLTIIQQTCESIDSLIATFRNQIQKVVNKYESQEKPTLEKPTLENPTQLNKDIQRTDLPKKEKSNTDLSSTHSIPILSPNPSPCREAATPPERKGTEAAAQSAVDIYREIIKDNIDYHILKQDMKFDGDRLDEIVDLMLETVCTARKRVRIAGDDYPAELVKSKFMKLDGEHIRFVLDCMRENTTKIRNIKQYLKAALFNAPSTIGNYYTSLVAHDMASGALSPKKPQYGDPDYYSFKPGESL